MPLTTLTYSEFATLLDCPKKWWFSYHQRLESLRPSSKLNLGSVVHDVLELIYSKRDGIPADVCVDIALKKLDKLISEHKEKGGFPHSEDEIKEMKDLITSMITQYILFARKRDDFEVVSLEEEFDVPIINPYTGKVHEHLRLKGKVDGTCREGRANLLIEHKTLADAAADWWWKYLNQVDFYNYGMSRKHGIEYRGTYLNILIKKIPRVPEILKKGGLSRAKDILTTEDIYRQAIADNGLNPADYSEILEILKNKGNRFIVRKAVYRHPSDMEQIERTIWWAINRKMKTSFFPKNKSDMCSWKCSFKELCIDDTPEVRDGLYRVRDSEHSELSDDQEGNDAP